MKFIIVDLEWNGAYSHRAHGYFNEIIEIGAVRLNDRLEWEESFRAVMKPVVSRKLTELVKDMTGITQEELEENGESFSRAMTRLRRFVGDDAVVMTWSTTDLLVLVENCRFFYASERIPFMERYADLQAYCQRQAGTGTAQQLGLSRAAALLGVSEEGLDAHRALDDSVLSARILQHVYDPATFAAFVRPADEEFYQRLLFKTFTVGDPESPLLPEGSLQFVCEECGCVLRRTTDWRFRSRALCAELVCDACEKTFLGRVQCRVKYEGPELKRRLTEKKPSEPEEMAQEDGCLPDTAGVTNDE